MGIKFLIFECTNTSCIFRFPIISGKSIPKWCPRCKSPLEIETTYIEDINYSQKSMVKQKNLSICLLLDNIRSAYNVGSILRSADGFNIKHVYLCGMTATPENPKVCKTSLGAERISKWSYSPNSLFLARKLQKEGNILFGMEFCTGSSPITDLKIAPTESIVLILGNEQAGIDPEIRKICNEIFYIPMMGNKSSFNVTIAFGIAAFYLNYIYC